MSFFLQNHLKLIGCLYPRKGGLALSISNFFNQTSHILPKASWAVGGSIFCPHLLDHQKSLKKTKLLFWFSETVYIWKGIFSAHHHLIPLEQLFTSERYFFATHKSEYILEWNDHQIQYLSPASNCVRGVELGLIFIPNKKRCSF